MTFEVDDLAFFLSRFQTYGADVFAAEFYITEGTEKTAAPVAGNDGLFLRMVKTACLIIDERLSGFTRLEIAKKCGKHIDLYRCLTGWAGDEMGDVVISGGKRRVTVRTGDIFHKSGFPDDPRITNTVMEGTFFIIESNHNISDTENHSAEKFCEMSSTGTAIADLFTV